VVEAEVRGAEGHLEWRPDPRLRLLASYSYADVDSARRELEESTPRHTASLFALYRMPRDITVSGLLYLVDEQRWLSEGSLVSGYGRLDLRLAKGFRLGSSRGEIALVAQGLPDGHPDFLETDAGYNERDPRAFVTLELAL
jgi:outer membrane receptor protein involved in Fe transport